MRNKSVSYNTKHLFIYWMHLIYFFRIRMQRELADLYNDILEREDRLIVLW